MDLSLRSEDIAELIATRRDVHAHPELGYEERRTAALVARRLRQLDYQPREGVGRTGVTALLEASGTGPCVLLRADMDALPIQEENQVPYRSTVPGVMHACGHDGHVAMGLCAARLLRRHPPPAGSVKWMFQPAEEGGNGAVAMIEDGILDDPPVSCAFGVHLWNRLDLGQIGVVAGPAMAAVDEFEIRVQGRGGHAAAPHETRDPVLAAAHVVAALQQVVSRAISPLRSAVVTVSAIHGGQAFNVIPDQVVLRGTARVFDREVWAALPGHVERVVRSTASAFSCEGVVEYRRLTRPLVNDGQMAARAREVAAEIVGESGIVEERTMGGEDFAEILQRVPGCFVFIGSRNAALGKTAAHHASRFDIDEAALSFGALFLAKVAHRQLAASA